MAQHLSSKNLLLQHSPLVVGILNHPSLLEDLAQNAARPPSCDLFELRLDTLNLPAEELDVYVSRLARPLLLTARHPAEGGDHHLSSSQRQDLLRAHLHRASLIDVELCSVAEMASLIQEAKALGIGVVGSFHDFASTPSDDILKGAVDFALQLKLDAVKIATTLHHPGDLARLLQLLHQEKRLPLSLMGMGSLGPVSRLVLARSGSILNYGFLGQPNVTGQLSAAKLKEILSLL